MLNNVSFLFLFGVVRDAMRCDQSFHLCHSKSFVQSNQFENFHNEKKTRFGSFFSQRKIFKRTFSKRNKMKISDLWHQAAHECPLQFDLTNDYQSTTTIETRFLFRQDTTRRDQKTMSKETNLIDFIHDHYANASATDISQTLTQLQQQLDQQRKLVLNEIASVQKEEELVKTHVQNRSNSCQKNVSNEKHDSSTSIDIEQINKMPLDL